MHITRDRQQSATAALPFVTCALAALLATSSLAEGQPTETDLRSEVMGKLQSITERANDWEAKAQVWENTSTVIIVMVVAVGVMGLSMSGLQKSTAEIGRRACIVMGLLVGFLTLINSTWFPADHRTYGYSAYRVRDLLEDIRDLLPRNPNALSLQVLEDRVEQGLVMMKQMKESERAIYRQWASAPSPPPSSPPASKGGKVMDFFVPEAHAEDAKPRIFDGTGESTLLRDARAIALTLATINASKSLAEEWSTDTNRVNGYAVRPFIEKVMDIVSQRVSEQRGLVRVQLSVSIPSEFASRRWSQSFGLDSSSPSLASGAAVLISLFPLRHMVSGKPFLGLVDGQVDRVNGSRATSLRLLPSRSQTEWIEDGSPVRLIAGDRLLAMVDTSLVTRPRDPGSMSSSSTEFTIRRVRADPDAYSYRPPSGRALRDGELVEILFRNKLLSDDYSRTGVEAENSHPAVFQLHRVLTEYKN